MGETIATLFGSAIKNRYFRIPPFASTSRADSKPDLQAPQAQNRPISTDSNRPRTV